jgi:hypothetical protein
MAWDGKTSHRGAQGYRSEANGWAQVLRCVSAMQDQPRANFSGPQFHFLVFRLILIFWKYETTTVVDYFNLLTWQNFSKLWCSTLMYDTCLARMKEVRTLAGNV